MEQSVHGVRQRASEWSYTTSKPYDDPFNEVELNVVFTDQAGRRLRMPAYWAGESEWRVRFAPPAVGSYRFETVCSDSANGDLHGRTGRLEVEEYKGDSPLCRHGALQVSADRRHLEHRDGAPFFWLGDTWWMGLCSRWSWPEDFQLMAADRAGKGFTVVQIVAGLYPDMPAFDQRGANEAGQPWLPGYERINPSYFDMADLRIQWLVRSGLVPCVVGCWGYFLAWMGVRRMKQHWRNLVARWAAYPVAWCLAGEATMPYYLSEDKERDAAAQKEGWTELARYVREIDPYRHPVTIHPTSIGRDQVSDDSVLDFDMLQTGHGGSGSVPNTVAKVRDERAREPAMPVLVGEVSYEGILHNTHDEMQRLLFWSAMLSGAAGHTYGANGIWQIDRQGAPFGPSPHGKTWGVRPWEEASQLPGSRHVGVGARLLRRFEWWRFEPHQEWVDPPGDPDNVEKPFAAGIPREVRVIYLYEPLWGEGAVKVKGIEPELAYRATFVDPCTGESHAVGAVKPDEHGVWPVPVQPRLQDWLLVLEAG